MFHRVVYGILASVLCSFSGLAADRYTLDSRHTFPSFEIDHLGFSLQRGRFNQSNGTVVLDSAAGKGSIDVTVNMASIDTGLKELEEHLQGDDFFDVARFPTMTFKSDKLQFAGDKLVGADGTLTLHGISKPVHLTVNHFKCGINPIRMKYTCGANAITTIKRSDFGVDKYVPMVADEVGIVVQVEASKD
ncbi:MAG: YceI family protein [Gammaproteobacteria bacterium]